MKSSVRKQGRIGSWLATIAALTVLTGCNNNTPKPSTALTGVTVNPASVTGPGTATGTVTIAPTSSSDTTITLQLSPSTAGSAPSQVVVPAGGSSQTFTVNANAVTASTPLDIAATLSGTTMHATLTINPPIQTLTAKFVVTPDSGTQANAGQCAVTTSGDPVNQNLLQCTFDGSSSTPQSAITNYSWKLPGLTSPITTTTPLLKDPKVGCGAGLNTVNVQLPVTLTVTSPTGTATTGPIMVLFTKAGPC